MAAIRIIMAIDHHNPSGEPENTSPAGSTPLLVVPADKARPFSKGITGVVLALLLLPALVWGYGRWAGAPARQLASVEASPVIATSSPTIAPTATLRRASPTPPAGFVPKMPLAGDGNGPVMKLPDLPPGGQVIAIPADAQAVGWASSLDGNSHLNDPNIHVGYFDGNVYRGMLRFDLTAVPPASRIVWAAITLSGLGDQNLDGAGVWRLNMLTPDNDDAWPALDFKKLSAAAVEAALLPELTAAELRKEGVNVFTFSPAQLPKLEARLKSGALSLRLDGPDSGQNNLFTWDSGYQAEQLASSPLSQEEALWRLQKGVISPETLLLFNGGDGYFSAAELNKLGRKPTLWLVSKPGKYIVVTPTPTPENALTAAAMAPKPIGTPSPLPPEWVTPIIVTATPLPANGATATYYVQVATAAAKAYGTATPTPLNVWTATPTAAKAFEYEYVTSTPTPQNIVTLAAQAATATYNAALYGTNTPVPTNWATPRVVTPPPPPANQATAEFYNQLAAAEAYFYDKIWTATPTAIFAVITPAPTFTPTPGPQPVPAQLLDTIVFLSDRAGTKEKTGLPPLLYAMDPKTGRTNLLSGRAFYDSARRREPFSADLRFRSFTQASDASKGKETLNIYYQDYLYHVTEQLTFFERGISYDPAWSPVAESIVFVSTQSGNDDIWRINRDGSGLLQLTNDINFDKSPSWSPDGTQIIFWSNRSGKAQLWIMDANGANQRLLAPNAFNDWNPVWVKYQGLAPPVTEATPTAPSPYDIYN